MTVRNEIHISGGRFFECVPFHCTENPFSQQTCCYYNSWNVEEHSTYPFTLSIYGEDPINIETSVYWITDPSDHYPTDLGLRLEQMNTIWEVYIDNYPQSVTRAALEVIVMIFATNNFSSFSTCIQDNFQSTEILSTDPSLPRDVLAIEGGDAVFSCEFGTSQPRPVPPVLPPTINFKFVYHSSDDNFSQSIMTANCSYWTHCTQWAPHSLPYLTNISLIHVPVIDLSNYLLYRYEIHLTNVAAELNGSTFSCSVATLNTGAQLAPPTELVQWEGAAELFVALKDESTPSMISSDPAGGHSHRTVGLAPILVPLGVTVTLLLTISGTVVGLVAWKRHQTRHHNLTGKGNWEFLKSEEDL